MSLVAANIDSSTTRSFPTEAPAQIDRAAIVEQVRRAIEIECEALTSIAAAVDEAAAEAVELLLACRGRVLVAGMGKTGLIGRKIAATLASTGTPAFFLHPADAHHGDLGVVTDADVLLALSNSGETDELLRLLPYFRRLGVPVIALTGNVRSSLARHSDVVIGVAVPCEADPLGIAPTASTTALLAMGDALAAAVLAQRGFTREQFSLVHPGGNLGRKLLLLVRDVMHVGGQLPLVQSGTPLRASICEMTAKRLGTAFVVQANGELVGILSDGDLRRLLQHSGDPLSVVIDEVMNRGPKTIFSDALAADALRLMEQHSITVLPVLDKTRRPIGAVHLHDLVQAGLP